MLVFLLAVLVAASSSGDERSLSVDSRVPSEEGVRTGDTLDEPDQPASGPERRSPGPVALGAPVAPDEPELGGDAPPNPDTEPTTTTTAPPTTTTTPSTTTTEATPETVPPHDWIGQECRLTVGDYDPEPPCGNWDIGECPEGAFGTIVSRWTDMTHSWSCG